MTAQPIEVGDLVLTASRRTARVVRLDEARGEATVERLDDGERVTFRFSWLLRTNVCTTTGGDE